MAYGINVKDHGAVGDGITDDTAAVQAAVDAATADGGGLVFLPPGTYVVTQVQLKDRIVLEGLGWASALKQKANTNGHLVVLANPDVEETVVRDLRLLGNKTQQTTTNHAIYYDQTGGTNFETGDSNHRIENLLINDFTGSGVVRGPNVRELICSGVRVHACDRHSFDVSVQGGTDNKFIGCTSNAAGLSGFNCAGTTDVYLACKSFGSGQAGVPGNGSGFLITQQNNYFAGCEAQENPEHGFLYLNGHSNIMAACSASLNNMTGFRLDNARFNVIQGVANSFPGFAYEQDWALQLVNGSHDNHVEIVHTGMTIGGLQATPEVGNNLVRINLRYDGRVYNNWGSPGDDNEHFTFGKLGSGGTGNPYYVLKTLSDNPPSVVIQAFDGSTSRTFMKLSFGAAVSVWGDPSASPAVSTSEPASALGSVVRRLAVRDASGNLLGYIPIYNAIS